MNLYDTIMKDVVMGHFYDSAEKIVIIDLSTLQPTLEDVVEVCNYDYDQSMFLNALLPLISHNVMGRAEIGNFLGQQLIRITDEYRAFDQRIRMEKMKRMAKAMGLFKDTALNLQHVLNQYDLYNRSGVLTVDNMDAEHLSATMTSVGKKPWTLDSKTNNSSLISETSSQYLGTILAYS
jgi:hypothetical protein